MRASTAGGRTGLTRVPAITINTQRSLTVSHSASYYGVLQVRAQGNRRPEESDRTLTVDVSKHGSNSTRHTRAATSDI